MITPDYSILFKQLDRKKLNDVQIVDTPTATIKIDGDRETKFGGYRAIVHYNKDKEIQHTKDRNNKRFRTLRKQQKKVSCRSLGDSFPDVIPLLNRDGSHSA